ncbi:MAG TPA: AAA family ATPase, partial [Solirubrobacteraceae bacterium]|nr:AAA family ATPase [Solirubrobacteraceae bacterium]
MRRLLADARSGRSGAIVLRGEAGVGKTALLEYVAECASGCEVAHVTGVQAEMELPFSALQQLLAPMLAPLENLPRPQREAMEVAFGRRSGPAPDLFLVGLAALGLLAEVAETRPLVCLVDDAQWLDRASAQTLAFVARRLLGESVALAFAVREPTEDFAGLPELVLSGLGRQEARRLLASVIHGRLDERGGGLVTPEAEQTIAPIAALLKLARTNGMRIAYSQDTHREGDPEWRIWPEH